MDKYLSAKKLIRRWNIRGIRLFNLCKKGELQPYNWSEEKIVTRDSYTWTKEEKELITKETEELKRISKGAEEAGTVLRVGMSTREPRTDEDFERHVIKHLKPKDCDFFDYSLPEIDSAANQKIKKFMEFDFKESDIKRYEIEHDLYGSDKDIEEYEKKELSTHQHLNNKKTTEQNKSIMTFYNDGQYWKIGKKGEEATLKHLDGFEYIAFLIRNKNEFFKPLEVYYKGNIPKELEHLNKIDFQKIGNASELKKTIEYLQEQLTTKDDQDERDKIKDQINNLRKIKNEGIQSFKQKSDKCRINVTKSIQRAVKTILEELPALKKYFSCGSSAIIKTGNNFSYQHDNFELSVHWIFDKPTQH